MRRLPQGYPIFVKSWLSGNVLIHGYAVIDRARVWRAVQDGLPALRAVLNDLLAPR